MKKYCEQCRDFHDENEMCPKYREQLKQHPEWLANATDFISVAAQQVLIRTQALDGVAQTINKIAGTNLAYEGTTQTLHDVMVFKQLNVDAFAKSGVFSSPETAQSYFNSLENTKTLMAKLGGTSHEVDVLMRRNGDLSSLVSHTELVGEATHNAPGIDGVTKVYKVFGGKETRFSVKSTQYNISPRHSTMNGVFHSIDSGTFQPGDVLEGTKGYKEAFFKRLESEIAEATKNGDSERLKLLNQYKKTKVIETGDAAKIKGDAERLAGKMKDGTASPEITSAQVGSKMAQGAIIGAAVSVTISGITNYIKYRNGEISKEDAFRDVGEDAVKGLLTGGAMAGISLFIPGGIIGFVAGQAIGMYLNAVCTNALDEVFGKGAYEQILHACGYTFGTAQNITEMLEAYQKNVAKIHNSNTAAKKHLESAKSALADSNEVENELDKWYKEHKNG